MCGICGQFNFGDQTPVLMRDLRAMADSIVHRGPDDEGYFVEGSLGFGFRRLSIIDLKSGHQPMSDADGSVWVVFNGEIYNFPELKKELADLGHVFRTNCDTEVIVHGYRQWGQDVLNRLNGMFGLAIWDVDRRRLTLARDPFGIKLVYYRIDNGQLYFGSEIRAVVAGADERPDVDPVSLNLFLRYRYTPSPYTIYKGVRKLAPGTMLTCENGECRVQRWYQYEATPFSPMKSSSEAYEELLHLYRRAIRRHLLSDVPVGLLLSGGADSALLLALMNECRKPWPTYSVGYGSAYTDDELVDAASTAAHFESLHTSVTLTRQTFERALPRIVSCLEEPIASSSIVPMYFVSERARQDVKVVLMGQGPDELFGGYRRHIGVRYGGIYKGLPAVLRGFIASAVGLLPRNEALKRAIYSLDIPDRMKRYQHVLSLMPGNRIDELFRDGLIDAGAGDAILESWQDFPRLSRNSDELGGFQFTELRSSLPDELLMYADKLSMAHSLEVRVPYLDREVVEYAERLSANFKVRNGIQKWLHRRVCRTLIPKTILQRKKRGFAVNVVDDWFRSTIGHEIEETLLSRDSLLYSYLRPSAVRRVFRDHRSGHHDNHKILFSLVIFDQWLRTQKSVVAA